MHLIDVHFDNTCSKQTAEKIEVIKISDHHIDTDRRQSNDGCVVINAKWSSTMNRQDEAVKNSVLVNNLTKNRNIGKMKKFTPKFGLTIHIVRASRKMKKNFCCGRCQFVPVKRHLIEKP